MVGKNKRGLATDSPSTVPSKVYANITSAFLGGDTSPVSSKSQKIGPLAAAIAKVKASMEGTDCSGPAWATVHLLLGAFEEQQAEIQELRHTVAEQQATIDRLTSTQMVSPDAAEEKERKRSVVVSGLPEEGAKPSERRTHDKKRMESLLDELDVDADIVSVYRMGAKTESDGSARVKPRLMKVVLGNSAQQVSLLRNGGKLKGSGSFGGVFVRASLTKEQLKEDYLLRKDLRERRAMGGKWRIEGWPGQERKIVPVQGN